MRPFLLPSLLPSFPLLTLLPSSHPIFALSTVLVDTYLLFAASALSAAAFLRSLAGFGFPLFAPTMYSALGELPPPRLSPCHPYPYTLFAAQTLKMSGPGTHDALLVVSSLLTLLCRPSVPRTRTRTGNGWGNSVLALAAAVIGIPAPFLIFKYGPKLRAMSTYAAAAS